MPREEPAGFMAVVSVRGHCARGRHELHQTIIEAPTIPEAVRAIMCELRAISPSSGAGGFICEAIPFAGRTPAFGRSLGCFARIPAGIIPLDKHAVALLALAAK